MAYNHCKSDQTLLSLLFGFVEKAQPLTMAGMKVVFIASLYEKEIHQFRYLSIIQLLKKLGHTVLHAHLTQFDLGQISQSEQLNGRFHRQVFQALKSADVMVAEITSQSLGVGYLIAEALRTRKPVLALTNEVVPPPLAAFLEEHDVLTVHHYTKVGELTAELPFLLSQLEPKKNKKFNVFLPIELDDYLLTTATKNQLSKSEYLRQLIAKDRTQRL